MSDKKSRRKRKDEYTGPGEPEVEKPSKEEYNVAKWLRRNVRTKKTKFLSHNVEYFTSNKALDAIMKSQFGNGDHPLFTTREHAIEFLDIMLEHKFFHRAKKIPVFPEELKAKNNGKKIDSCCSGSGGAGHEHSVKEEKKTKKHDEKKLNEKITDVDSHAEGAVGDQASISENQKEKRKRKIRLDMHPEQVFVDGSEAYVWIYDPIPVHYWIFGFILVLGAIVICLFPLWPPILRKGVYYLSIAAAGFLVFILVLTIIRLIIFVLIWALTAGKLHFWIFPNLTEDVGFFASFWPLYISTYQTDLEKAKAAKKSKKNKKKDKDSDAENEDIPLIDPETIENIKEHDVQEDLDEDEDEEINDDIKPIKTKISKNESQNHSESESETGSRSSTGKDFEMVDPNDVDTS